MSELEFLLLRKSRARLIIYLLACLSGYNLSSVIRAIRFDSLSLVLFINSAFLLITFLGMLAFVGVKCLIDKKIERLGAR